MTLNPFAPVARQPPVCPYCGSIESRGNICDWCHSTLTENYESEENIMATIDLSFKELDPQTALALIKYANSLNAENTAATTQENTSVSAADNICPAPVLPTTPPPAATAAPAASLPTAAKQYTADELAIAARPLVETGRQTELLDLLHSFTYTDSSGTAKTVQSVREMPPEFYPAFANGLRQLGGRI